MDSSLGLRIYEFTVDVVVLLTGNKLPVVGKSSLRLLAFQCAFARHELVLRDRKSPKFGLQSEPFCHSTKRQLLERHLSLYPDGQTAKTLYEPAK